MSNMYVVCCMLYVVCIVWFVGVRFLGLLTLSAYVQEGWVCVCVCLSVKSHLTSGVSVRPENTVTYSTDNDQKLCVFF